MAFINSKHFGLVCMSQGTGKNITVGGGREPIAVTIHETSFRGGTRVTLPTGSFVSTHTSKQQHRDIDGCCPYRPLLLGPYYLYEIIWPHATGCLAFACSCFWGVGGIKIALCGPNTLAVRRNVITIILELSWQFLQAQETSWHRASKSLRPLLSMIWRQFHSPPILTTCVLRRNPLKTKGNLFYIRTQCVPRCKHSAPRL
jgi:hypothetical protein